MKRLHKLFLCALLIFSTLIVPAFAWNHYRWISYGNMEAKCSLLADLQKSGTSTAKARTDMVNPDWYKYRVWVTLRGYNANGDVVFYAKDTGYSWGEQNLHVAGLNKISSYHSIDNSDHSVEYVGISLTEN
ncbi:MAG: hypothetical protein Q4G61_02800 [Tissierellia bacterium]|nr:hypothetical protein [Tissierellia bacterium]